MMEVSAICRKVYCGVTYDDVLTKMAIVLSSVNAICTCSAMRQVSYIYTLYVNSHIVMQSRC